MMFSFSRLKMYELCPFRFYKKYIKGYEEPTSLPLALGKAVHKGIEDIIKGLDHNNAVINAFVEADFFSELNREEISEFINRAPVTANMGITEQYFELPLDGTADAPIIRGYVDLLQLNNRNEISRIIDWKTNRIMYNVASNQQVALYSWAINQMYGVQLVMGSLFFLRYRKYSNKIFDLSDMESARQWALNLAHEIRDNEKQIKEASCSVELAFPAKASSNCRTCPFVLECYYRFPS